MYFRSATGVELTHGHQAQWRWFMIQASTVAHEMRRTRAWDGSSDTGEERYALITGNLYGLPTSARVFSQERDRLLLEEMPRRWLWPDAISSSAAISACEKSAQ